MLPKINQLLYIWKDSYNPRNQESVVFKSRLADIKDEGLLIEAVHNGEPFVLGSILQIQYTTEEGMNCSFASRIIGFEEDNIKLALIEKPQPDSIKRMQRRGYFRVPAELEIAVQSKGLHFVTVTQDISGGGLSFFYDLSDQLVYDQELSFWLLLSNKNKPIEPISLRGRVVRLKDLGHRQLVMVEYTKIQEIERQKIMRYCLERQLELHKNA